MNFLEEPTAPQGYPHFCLLLVLTKLPREILNPAGHCTLSDVTGLLMGTSCQQPVLLRHCGTVPCWVKSLPLPLCWSPWAPDSSSLMELPHSCCSLLKKLTAEIFQIHLSPFLTCAIWPLGSILKRNPKKCFFPALFIEHKYLLFVMNKENL